MIQSTTSTDFPTWLRIQMAQRNINNSGLAQAIDVSHVAVGKWAQGEGRPNFGSCIKLARFFHIPEDQVLTIAGHRQPNIIGNNTIAEPKPTYHTSPRARLSHLLDQLTDDQIQTLITFLETIK